MYTVQRKKQVKIEEFFFGIDIIFIFQTSHNMIKY